MTKKKAVKSYSASPAAQGIYTSVKKAVVGHSQGINVMKLIDAELEKAGKKDPNPELVGALEKAKAEAAGWESEHKQLQEAFQELSKENDKTLGKNTGLADTIGELESAKKDLTEENEALTKKVEELSMKVAELESAIPKEEISDPPPASDPA